MATQDEVKVYTPEVIPDTPFPITGEDDFTESNATSSQTTKGMYGPKETKEKQFPSRMVAKELFSTAINTISKKIMKTFEFAKSGAIQIGEYIHGVAGEIKISPDGIVAKNKDGNTTFALDGETGNAIFSGDVRASTFTTDYFNVDEKGNVLARSLKFLDQDTASDLDLGESYHELAGSESYPSGPPFASVTESDANIQYVPGLELDLNILNDSYVSFHLSLRMSVNQTAAQALVDETYYLNAPVYIVEIKEGSYVKDSNGNPLDIVNNLDNSGVGHSPDIKLYSYRVTAQVANYAFSGCSDYPEEFVAFGIAQVPAGEHKYKVALDIRTKRFDGVYDSEARVRLFRSKFTAFTLGTV